MKKLLFIFLLGLAIKTSGQTAVTNRTSIRLDEKSVVKDGTGTVLPYKIWQKLLQSGEYSIKPAEQGGTEFVVYQMSEEEKVRAAERKKAMAVNMPKPMPSSSFKEGEPFKGEKITDISGNKFDLRKFGDKIYVINFWFINCPPCRQEIPELNELVKRYKDNKEVVFLAIALDDSYSLKQFLKTSPFNYNVVDDGRYYATKYGVTSYPTHVIIGKDGLVKFSTLGLAANTIHWIEKTIAAQLTGG